MSSDGGGMRDHHHPDFFCNNEAVYDIMNIFQGFRLMFRQISILFILLLMPLFMFADKPEWILQLPFSDDAFWGVGNAASVEEAEILARQEILMQMSSRVQAVISMEVGTSDQSGKVTEDLEAFFSGNSLRGAETVEQYSESKQFWVLMKYCEECGRSLLRSALIRFEDNYKYETPVLMEYLSDERISHAFIVERRLKELHLADYSSDDIIVRFSDMQVVIMIINFIPYETDLSVSQRTGLDILSRSMLKELKKLEYKSIDIVGHANPTSAENEDDDLMELSRIRAETMAAHLSAAGLAISSISWRGGRETLGNINSSEGKGLNRRVEIFVNY